MNYSAAVAYLEAHAFHGIRPGLERITGLLELMGRPDREYPIIHITGTNGKTSTARMVSSLLTAHGFTTGTHISPHLQVVSERILINGEQLSPADFAQAVTDVAGFADIYEAEHGAGLTYFELMAAAAFACFANQAVDVAVVEVGLGGRLDATNVVESKVAVLTGVELEHTEYLGNTLAEITSEKVAILNRGGALVTGPLPPEAEPIVAARVKDLETPWRAFGRDFSIEGATMAVGGWLCDIAGVYSSYPELELLLHGRHQLRNLAIAIASTEALFGKELRLTAVQEGVAAVRSPGRLEVIARRPLVLIDGAHTPGAITEVARSLDEEFPPWRWVVVIGVSADKRLPAMLEALGNRVASVVGVAANNPRAVPAESVAAAARSIFDSRVSVQSASSVAEGIAIARGLAGENGQVLVTGSLYMVGEARSVLIQQTGSSIPGRDVS